MAEAPKMSIAPIQSFNTPQFTPLPPQDRLQMSIDPSSSIEQLRNLGLTTAEISKIKKTSIPETSIKDIEIREPKRTGTYDPRTGMFISPSQTGFGATGVLRQPTLEETRRIREEDIRGGIFTDKTSQEVVEKARQTQKEIKDYSRLSEQLENKAEKLKDLEEGNVEGEQWVGSEKDYKKYKKQFEDYQETLSELESLEGVKTEGRQLFFEPEKIGVKLPLTKTTLFEVPVEEFTAETGVGVQTQAVSEGISFLGEKAGTQLGESYLKITPSARFLPPKIREKVGEAVGQTAKYFIPVAGQTFFAADIEKSVRPFDYKPIEFAKQRPVEAGILGGVILTAGAIRGVRYLRTPRLIEGSVKGGETIKLDTRVFGRKVATDEGAKELAMFKDMWVRSPKTGLVQSPIRRLMRKEPELVVLQRGQTYIGEPVLNFLGRPIDTGEPYLYMFGRAGKTRPRVNEKLFLIKGESKGISPEGLKELPSQERYLFEKLVQRTKTGRPTKVQDIPLFLGESQLLQRGSTEVIDLGKLGTGRSRTLGSTGSIVTPITTLPSGTQTFRIERGFKDVTKPLSRASGKVDVTTDIFIRLPSISRETSRVNILRPSGTKKTPLSKTFQEQLQKQKPTPIKRPDITPPKAKPTKAGQELLTPTESIWAGTGLYERTTGTGVMGSILRPQRQDFQLTTPIDIQPQRTLIDKKVDTKIDIKPKIDFRLSQEPKQIQRPLTRLDERIKQPQREILRTRQITRQIQRSLLKQPLRTKTPTKLITPLRPRTPRTPKTPKLLLDLPEPSSKKDSLFKGLDEDEFKVFVRRKGEDIGIGEFPTLESAGKKLKGELLGTLRASGFVTDPTGKKVKLDFGSAFRPSKKDPFRIVQRKTKRLGALGETKEIQFFRKQKSGGSLI